MDQFIYLGISISSTLHDVNIQSGKASNNIEKLSDKIKQEFFQVVAVLV